MVTNKISDSNHSIEHKLKIKSNMQKHRATLLSLMECQFGLLDELIAMDVLDDTIFSLLSVPMLSSYKQNKMVLDFFCDKDIKPEPFLKLDRFVEALNGSHQSHLAALLTGNFLRRAYSRII